MSKRQGFTLVELMVAMTLTLFVMLIMTQAFVTSLDSFETLKGIGDMEAHLRTAITALRTDLTQDHFEGKLRLSDTNFTTSREGFFYLSQQAFSQHEGNDINGIPSYGTWTAGGTPPAYHVLAFTNRLRGNQRDKVYVAGNLPSGSPLLDITKKTNFFGQPNDALFHDADPPTRFHSNWAVIAYTLVRTGSSADLGDTTTTDGSSGTPLHALYRSEQLLVPNTTEVNNPATTGVRTDYPGVSVYEDAANPGTILFNSPADVTKLLPNERHKPPVAGAPSAPLGSTLLLTNVVAFNVRVLRAGVSEDLSFDTRSGSTTLPVNVQALEITIRIWDQKTEQARQVTIVQGL